jgi:cytidylate kinase
MIEIPVIAIDGPAASGKGAVAQAVAERLGFHYLDSGAIYRAAAHAVARSGLNIDSPKLSEADVASIALNMRLDFKSGNIYISNQNVTEEIRSEECGKNASKIAVLPKLRQALLELQHGFRRAPGLVAEGRDMGTVVFPDAVLKVFLTASAEVRAERRHKQLMEKGINANMKDLLKEIEARDARDLGRSVAPLRVGEGTITVDTSALNLAQSIDAVLKLYKPNASKNE